MTAATGVGGARSAAWVSFALLITLWLVWGVSWPAMRIVFLELQVWQFRAVTSLIGGTILLLLAVWSPGGWRIPRALWPSLALAAFFNIIAWNAFIGYGLHLIGAGHGAIVCYTMPVWTAILSAIFLHEAMTPRKVLALVLGIGGVSLLVLANLGTLGGSPFGVALVFGAAVSWAIGTIIVKRVAWPANMSALAGWQILMGVPVFIVLSALFEHFTLFQMSGRAFAASLYVLLGGMVGGYFLWFRIVDRMPASIAAIGTLMVPVIGVISGALVLGETLTWREGAALVLVLAAIGLVVFAPRRVR
jgi:drug/metabolite transporter (DMT)-like permease